jgi:hypothetical protein
LLLLARRNASRQAAPFSRGTRVAPAGRADLRLEFNRAADYARWTAVASRA